MLASVPGVLPLSAFAGCNRVAALNVQAGIREFAKWRIGGDHLAVHWIYKIEKLSESERLNMVRTYTDIDACLSGGAREILFYRNYKILDIASPSSGIRVTK